MPNENIATQISVTTINETTMDVSASSDTENDLLNEALIDDENETMRGKKYNNIENFHNKLVRL